MPCVGLDSTILSGDIYPKPEVLGVRLVFVNVAVLPDLSLFCCVFRNGFIFFFWWTACCDLRHKMAPCNTC